MKRLPCDVAVSEMREGEFTSPIHQYVCQICLLPLEHVLDLSLNESQKEAEKSGFGITAETKPLLAQEESLLPCCR